MLDKQDKGSTKYKEWVYCVVDTAMWQYPKYSVFVTVWCNGASKCRLSPCMGSDYSAVMQWWVSYNGAGHRGSLLCDSDCYGEVPDVCRDL